MEEKMIKPIGKIIESSYIIPLYQRNFAWGDREIKQLVTDLYRSMKRNQAAYFIGSLITLKRGDNEYEVIDGQQRLTAVSLILKYLAPKNPDLLKPYLHYDSREEVQSFLVQFHQNTETYDKDAPWLVSLNNDSVLDFVRGLDSIDNAPLDILNKKSINSLSYEEKESFSKYILDHVMLVHVIMPDETDVASYFEIMNNRGVQLQSHEVIKSRLMGLIEKEAMGDDDLAKKNRTIFATIWDACAEMDHKVQRNIKGSVKREALFGPDYSELHLENIAVLGEDAAETRIGLTINEILNSENIHGGQINEEEDTDSDSNIEQSVVDFQNFLLHVFKVKYNDKYILAGGNGEDEDEDNGVPLHEKFLISTYDILREEIKPMEFIKDLLMYRVIFDRYVIKVNDTKQNDGTQLEDEPKWILHVAKKRESDRGKGRAKSFSVGHEDTFSRQKEQEYIVKALSMLQVTYRQRRYKNYLTDILQWFSDGNLSHSGKWYLDKLNGYILNVLEKDEYYKPLRDKVEFGAEGAIADGTKTPHFLFNFIDYLYWVAWKKKMHNVLPELQYLDSYSNKDFVFKYSNSVEHHCPQSAVTNGMIDRSHVDSLGNLCLISKSANSKLGNEDPKGKASPNHWYYKPDLSPMRKIMYDITNSSDWDKDRIEERYNGILRLISLRSDIIGRADIDINSPEVVRSLMCTCNLLSDTTVYGTYTRNTIRVNLNIPEQSQAMQEINAWLQANPTLDLEDYISGQLAGNENLKRDCWRYLFVKYPRMYKICNENHYRRIFFIPEKKNTVILLKGERWSSSNYSDLMTVAVDQELKKKGIITESWTNSCIHWIRIPVAGAALFVSHDYEDETWYYYLAATRDNNMSLIQKLNSTGWTRIGSGQYQISGEESLIASNTLGMIEEVTAVQDKIMEILDNVSNLSTAAVNVE